MSNSNRRILAAFAGIAALFVATGAGAFYGSLYSPAKKQYAAVDTGQGTSETYEGVTESLPDIAFIPDPVERAIANPPPNSGQDHEKRDLAAQENMAVWAFYMALFSGVTAIITGVGTYFIAAQLKLTREAVQQSSNATNVMLEANEISKNQVRAYLNLTEPLVQINPFKDFHYNVGFTLENTGQSKAVDLWFVCESRWGDPRTPDDYFEHISEMIPIAPVHGQTKVKIMETIDCRAMTAFDGRMDCLRYCQFTISLSGHDVFHDPVDLKAFAVFISPLEPMGSKMRVMSLMHERHRVDGSEGSQGEE